MEDTLQQKQSEPSLSVPHGNLREALMASNDEGQKQRPLEKSDDEGQKQQPLPVCLLVALNATWFGTSFVAFALSVVAIPSQVSFQYSSSTLLASLLLHKHIFDISRCVPSSATNTKLCTFLMWFWVALLLH